MRVSRRAARPSEDITPRVSCPSCAGTITGRHCAECGELRPDLRHHTAWELLESAFESLTHLDHKILRTLGLLLARPGFLAAEYMRGARARYVPPFQLFLIVNVAFFAGEAALGGAVFATPLRVHVSDQWQQPYQPLAQRMLRQRLEGSGVSEAAFAPKFDRAARGISKFTVLLMVPLLALAMALVGPWRRLLLERLVFGLHVLSAALIVLGAFPLMTAAAQALAPALSARQTDTVLSPLLGLVLAMYFYKGLRTLAPQPAWVAALRALLLVGATVIALQVVRFAVFALTLYSVPPGL